MKFGEVKTFNHPDYKKQIHYGKLYLLKASYYYLKGYKIIRWWVGTDSDLLISSPIVGSFQWRYIYRPLHIIKAKLSEPIISFHRYGCDHVKDNLTKFGIKKSKLVFKDYPLLYPNLVDKSKPKILLPLISGSDYKRWYHGYDIAVKLMVKFDAHYFTIDGEQNLEPYFAVVDMCILTKRAIGNPRLKRECELNNIPVYYNPYNPNIKDITKFTKENTI